MDKLLSILSENADFTPAQLAAMLNESEDSVKARIEKYREDGVIKGYQALVDWSLVEDSGVTAFIELKVTPKPETGFDEIAKQVMSFDKVESVYLVASSTYDLLAVVKGDNINDIAMFVSKRLSTLDSVISTATHFLLNKYKESGVVLHDECGTDEQRSLIM